MAKYGLTPKGPNIKRLDVILDEMHDYISKKIGVNTRQNPQSLLNHMLTNISDRVAELWEFGEEIYYSQYPSSAEFIDLDNAAQYGGSTRGLPNPSYYHIRCTGVDGSVIPAGTLIASDTNPTTQLVLNEQKAILRSLFNTVSIKLAVSEVTTPLTVAINGTIYSYTPKAGNSVLALIQGLAAFIINDDFTVSVDEGAVLLCIAANDVTSNNALILSENLTTETVGTIITFATEEEGDILLPNGVINKIVRAVTGLQSVVNVGSYIAGNLAESDIDFRKSYVDKIFSRSSRMLESIKSAILDNVQGVKAVAAYENYSNAVDEMGRWPHCVEVVADGGDQNEIAIQILNSKAGGINTFGSVEVDVPGEYGESIPIRFNRPTYLYVWFHVGIIMSKSEALPSNYSDLIREIILENMDGINAGADVVPQRFISDINANVPGIDYIDFTLAVTDAEQNPDEYSMRSITVTPRERAVTSDNRIEVVIDG